MDYEKKYKDALERAEKALEVFGTDKCEGARQIFSLFPELKESEDEKIRKELIDYINRLTASPNNIEKYNTWIAWLEKQGEQNPTDLEKFIIELSKQFPDVPFGKLSRIAVRTAKWAKPTDTERQKPDEWSEEDKKMCQETIDWFEKKCFPYALEEENPAKESITWLKSLKDRCTWKPNEWQLKAIKWILDGDNPENWTVTLAKLYNDLKKL